ncbi:MAG: hypothetical protein JW768_07725 [Chitinispirillaceae bacterium]|nr:hypothetical protein [Chitinispirillaceae bacterium]
MKLSKTGALIITGALAIIMLNCWDWGVNPPPTLRLNDTLTIAYHDTLFNLEENLWLSFDSLVEGRCPSGYNCMTVGWALIWTTFSYNNKNESFILKICENGFSEDTTILNHRFKFIYLYPYPDHTINIVPEEYSAKIFITN